MNIVETYLSATSKTEKMISNKESSDVIYCATFVFTVCYVENDYERKVIELEVWFNPFLLSSLLTPPENMRKPNVFWRVHGGSTGSIRQK